MRLVPGNEVTVAQQSITSRLLVNMGVIDPDMMTTIFSMYPEMAPLTALLDAKNYKTEGINYGTNWLLDGGRFNTVSSNHVQYRIANDDYRVERFRPGPNGVCYEDEANASQPGLSKLPFYIYLDSNYAGGNEVILLADGETQLYIIDKDAGERVSGGVWRYRVKVDGNNKSEYVDTNLMQDGDEVQVVTSKYTQDFSVGGNEKYDFGGFGDAYLTLQRFKYSYSGTAAAMDKNKQVRGRYVGIPGYEDKAFITAAEEIMMKNIARYLDFQLLEGKGTVSKDTKEVVLTDGANQDILSGNGVLYSGDGPIEFPLNNGWTEPVLTALLRDIDTYIRPDENGKREVALFLHPTSYFDLQTLLASMNVTQNQNIIGDGDNKIINNTYKGYSLGGITLLLTRSTSLSRRPGKVLKDGTKSNEWVGIMLPLGLTASGDRGIQLIQLRPMSKGTVAGIDKGGNISSEVDGSSEHALIQNGVISQIQPIKLYRPYLNNLM